MGAQTPQAQPPATAQTADPEAIDRSAAQNDPYGQPQGQVNGQRPAPAYGVPPQLALKPGTFISVRTNAALSSDHNHIGDTFTAMLMQPVIVDGVIVANRGMLVYGRVTDAEKAHSGQDSRLGLELTSFTLVDGTQAMVHTQLVAKQQYQAPGSSQPGTVIGTAPANTASNGANPATVLMTHGHATSLYPETALTFNITTPVAINTANSAQAFRYAGPDDYPNMTRPATAGRPTGSATYVYGPGYAAPYPYYYPYYPYYWGPSIGIGFGWGGFGGFRGRWR
jgi:hypothetical protein